MVESIVRSLITYDDYFKLIDFGNAKNNFQLIRKYRDRIGHDDPILDFEEFLDDILDRLDKKNTKLLLLLDEFEKIQEGIDSGLTAPQVPQNLRAIIQKFDNFSVLLTSGLRGLKQLNEDYWSVLFGLGPTIPVTNLSENDSRLLIQEPVKDYLTYSDEAINEVFYLTNGQPFLIQLICDEIYSYAASNNERYITKNIVDVARDKYTIYQSYFHVLWSLLRTNVSKLILIIILRDSI